MNQCGEPKYNKIAERWEYSIEKYNKFTGKIETIVITGDSKFEVTIELIKHLEYRSYKLLEASKDFDQDYNK